MKIKIFIIFLLTLAIFSHSDILFFPTEWDFGTITPQDIFDTDVQIENRSTKPAEIKILSTCDCIWALPDKLTIQAGSLDIVKLFFDPTDEYGDVEKFFLIYTNIEGFEKKLFFVYGKLPDNPNETDVEQTNVTPIKINGTKVKLFYYYTPSCSHCRRFIESTIPGLEKDIGITIELVKKDITNDPDSYTEYRKKLDSINEQEKAFPLLFIGNKVLQGNSEIDKKIRTELNEYLKNKKNQIDDNKIEKSDDHDLKKKMSFLPAITAGLIDGINPCAFATLISLLTALALAGKRRKEILIIGIFFTLAVFTTYYLVGLGFFKAIQLASSFSIISIIIHWILVAVLFLFAALSFYDFYLIKQGRSGEMILQLPDSFKKRIQRTIKTQIRSAAIVLSSIVLGFLVSIFELGCTGQVYFPFITVYVLKIQEEAFGYILLLIYNLGFIVPLIAVFAITYIGINSKKFNQFFQKHMGTLKILLALLFIGLAIFMIVSK